MRIGKERKSPLKQMCQNYMPTMNVNTLCLLELVIFAVLQLSFMGVRKSIQKRAFKLKPAQVDFFRYVYHKL